MTRVRLGLVGLALSAGWCALAPRPAGSAPIPKEGTTPYVKWRVEAEPVSNEMHNPLVVRDMVVVGTDRGDLCAYRCKDGKPVWKHEHGKRIFHRPCGDGDRVYFASADGLTAVAADTGKLVWRFTIDHGDGPSLALGEKGRVFLGGSDGKLYALDAKTGELLWSTDFVADAPPDPPGFPGGSARVGGSPARPSALSSDGETLFLSVFDQSRVVAFDAATGKKVWSYQTGGWIYGEVAATATHAFVGSQDDFFYCLDKRTGKQVWKFKTQGRIESGGVVDDTSVYFASCDGGLYGLSRSDGKLRWRFEADRDVDGRRSAIYSTPVLHRGALHFAAGEGQVYAVDAGTGKLRWKLRPSERSELYCSPASDGTSYFVTTRPRGSGRDRQGESSLFAVSLK